MPQQLFLFDNEPPKDAGASLPGKDESTLLPAETSNDSAQIKDLIEETNPSTNEPLLITDPFAELQRQQQEKIDNLLLLPNKKRGRKSFKDMDNESILIDVPEDDILFQKQYYPTRIVAEWFGVSATQLRAWENAFDILEPKKNGKGDRFFRPEDIKNLKLIYHLIRIRKFTVQGAIQYFKENKQRLQTTMQLTESLQKFKQFLLELKAIAG